MTIAKANLFLSIMILGIAALWNQNPLVASAQGQCPQRSPITESAHYYDFRYPDNVVVKDSTSTFHGDILSTMANYNEEITVPPIHMEFGPSDDFLGNYYNLIYEELILGETRVNARTLPYSNLFPCFKIEDGETDDNKKCNTESKDADFVRIQFNKWRYAHNAPEEEMCRWVNGIPDTTLECLTVEQKKAHVTRHETGHAFGLGHVRMGLSFPNYHAEAVMHTSGRWLNHKIQDLMVELKDWDITRLNCWY